MRRRATRSVVESEAPQWIRALKRKVLLDTGPLVAFLNRRDRYHGWARTQWAEIESPLWTCEAVISEACFILGSYPGASQAVMEMISRGIVQIPFRLEQEARRVSKLVLKYQDVPMSVADACLVRMTEQTTESPVFTLDGDFKIYRRLGRQVIPTLMPGDL